MDNNFDSVDWDFLLNSINQSHAVLLLGHGFLHGAHEQLYADLQQKLGGGLQHFYSRDGLFLFKDKEAKTKAQQAASMLYAHRTPDESVLKKIVEMPFRVMISANPDKSLCTAFAKYRHPLQFDYFSSKHKEQHVTVERPAPGNPLLYNLCGSYEDQESLILDYDDLFDLFRNMLPDLGIPDTLRGTLVKCNTYIFIGFHFERWYTQLFLRYLNMNENRFDNKNSNYILKTVFQSSETQQFFLEQFNVKFIGADLDFLEELHRRYAERFPQSLRKLVDELSPVATAISQLVSKEDYQSAFRMMDIYRNQLDEDDQKLLVMTEADYNKYRTDKDSGAVSKDNLDLSLARVRNNLLDLARKIK